MATTANPTRDDFAALLNESLGGENEGFEGRVVKGTVTAIENDLAVIDVGLKSRRPRAAARVRRAGPEGRAQRRRRGRGLCRPRREHRTARRCCSRDRARREAAWDKLETEYRRRQPRRGRDLRPRQGRLHRRSRRRRRLPARQPGRHPPGPRRRPADGPAAALPDPEDGPPPRQHRRLAPRHPRGDPRRAALGPDPVAGRGPGDRRRRQEHHRLRRLRRSRRHRRPAPRHRHQLQARRPPVRGDQHRRHGEGADHPHQPRDPAHQPRHEAARERSVGRRRRQISGRRRVHAAGSPTSPNMAPSSSSSRASRAWSTSPR